MIVGLGVDLVAVARLREMLARHEERLLERLLTEAEREYVCRYAEPAERLAGRWAAKEAAFKALGTGQAEGLGWRQIEVLNDALGRPVLSLRDLALARARELGAERFHVSISHADGWAVALVILERS